MEPNEQQTGRDEGAEAWERFQRLGRRVVSVSADEIRRREAEYKSEGKHKPRKAGRPRKQTAPATP